MAQTRLEEITQQERTATAEIPGDSGLTVRTPVEIAGTAGCADQTYRIASIDRSFSFTYGYLMTLRLKNHSPQTVTAVS